MSAVRYRTPGNNPETRIFCNGLQGSDKPCNVPYVADANAREARKRAKTLDWVRVDGKDYCPEHWSPFL